MTKNDEKLTAANLTKIMAMMCVRNTKIEDIHAGVVPVSKTGDFSDVMVVDADGRKIPWTDVSHFDDDIMRDWMRDVVNKLDTFQLNVDDPYFQKVMARWASVASKWDDPELDKGFMQAIDRFRKMDNEEG